MTEREKLQAVNIMLIEINTVIRDYMENPSMTAMEIAQTVTTLNSLMERLNERAKPIMEAEEYHAWIDQLQELTEEHEGWKVAIQEQRDIRFYKKTDPVDAKVAEATENIYREEKRTVASRMQTLRYKIDNYEGREGA